MADVSQIKLPNGSVYDLIDEKSGYITAEYIENKTDYEIPVSRVGEIVVGETAIGTDSTNFPTSKAVVDYVDERVVQEMDAIDVGVTGIKADGRSLNVVNGVVNIPGFDIHAGQSGLFTNELYSLIGTSFNNISNSIPTSTSQLTNDSGFITASDIPAETDPTVPAWAKASSKPSYSLTEISGTDDLRVIEGLTGTTGLLKKTAANTWTLDTNTYLTSYTETDPTVPSWAKASSKPSYGLTEISGTDDLRAIEALTGMSGLLKKTAANTWTLDTNTYLTSYTETDPVFSASAAAGITSTDISNWNAKVSDDKTWNGVSLDKTEVSRDQYYIPGMYATTASSAELCKATSTPTARKIALYNANSYLISTTPSANDNSTKVATTAYVDAAIPDTSGFISKSGDTMSGRLTLNCADGTSVNNRGLLFDYGDTYKALLNIDGGNYTGSQAIARLIFSTVGTTNGVILCGIATPDVDTAAANKKYVDNAIPKVYSSTNTGGYLTMATLPIYDGTVE